MERYGVDNFAKSEKFIEKSKKTCLERYGETNPMKSEKIKQRLIQTNQNRFGVDWVQQNANVLSKRLETCKARYGAIGWAASSIHDKSIATHKARYGSSHWRGSEELTAKINATCGEKHNVEWPCQYPEVRSALNNDSKPNREFAELLEQRNIPFEREFGIDRFSYDFKVENILVEIDPSCTHNSTWGVYGLPPTDKNYHKHKSELAVSNGYRCIHVWDWDNKQLVINQLERRSRIYARSCTVQKIDKAVAAKFINQYHLQGYVRSEINLGLFFNNSLVSVMTFGKPRYNKKYEYELLRYCSSHQVVGGAEKLFSWFVNHNSPKSIISYCDMSKFTGNVYNQLHFNLLAVNVSKHWYNMRTHKHITDNLLRQRGFDQLFGTDYGKGTSNEKLMLDNGFVEIYDAGQATYVWNSSS